MTEELEQSWGGSNWVNGWKIINTYIITGIETSSDCIKIYSLTNNYPNPFNPSTIIKYSVPENEYVTLKVYDAIGNEISTLVNEEKQAGNYEVEFSAPGGATSLSSGIYFYRLQAGSFVETKKMVLLK
ncbi:MAG: hypothetical protein DRQ13_10780 [Ignavibacteriae bacterium]|nr:MAG: hypothetical protein DRQ13_10780 [Ignavibacteriota bacterium]